MSSLPPGWIRKVSSSKRPGLPYYFNPLTKEIQWELPTAPAVALDTSGASSTSATPSAITIHEGYQPQKASRTETKVEQVSIVASGLPVNVPIYTKRECISLIPQPYSIDVRKPHVKRVKLLEEFSEYIQLGTETLILAPQGQGKTASVLHFHEFHPEFKMIEFVAIRRGTTSYLDQFRSKLGLDNNDLVMKDSRLAEYDVHQIGFLIWIDDAQHMYDDNAFWEYLMRRLVPKLRHQNVPFALVISATRTIATGGTSPVDLKSIRSRIESVVMTDEEAMAMLSQGCPFGLHSEVKYKSLMDLIVRECRGHGAALRMSINMMNAMVLFESIDVSEPVCFQKYLNQNFTSDCKTRCFSAVSSDSQEVFKNQSLLIDMLSGPVVDPFACKHDLPRVNKSPDQLSLEKFIDCGILAVGTSGTLQYESPLAMRVMSSTLFPKRASANNFNSLGQLVIAAVKLMSASVLETAGRDRRPKEAVYRRQMMEQICSLTTPGVSILPELGYTFGTNENHGGCIDLFIDDFHFGLELLIDGSKLREHISRFAPDGKYSLLAPKEYLVVDFRVDDKTLATEDVSHLMTIRFKDRTMTSADVFHGTQKIEVMLMP